MKIPELQGATEFTVADASGNASVPDPQISGIGARHVTAGHVRYRAVAGILPQLYGSGGQEKILVLQEPARMGTGGRERERCRAFPENDSPVRGAGTPLRSAESRDGTEMSDRTDGENRPEHSGPGCRR